MQLPNPSAVKYTVAIHHSKAIRRSPVWAKSRAVLPDGFPVGIDDGINTVILEKYGGMFALVMAHAGILSGGDAPCRIGKFRIFIVIHQIQPGLSAEAAAGGRLCYGCSACVVDSLSLRLMICEFGKSFSAFSLDR